MSTVIQEPIQQEDAPPQRQGPLPLTPSYYRSKAVTTHQGVNPLVMAANPLFTLINKLRATSNYSDLAYLQQQLTHEIRAFESQAQDSEHRPETILAARYLLCALIDDTILHTSWGNKSWQPLSLLSYFHGETWRSERFQLLLTRLLEEPKRHIDLIELAYFSLNMGFEGKHRKDIKEWEHYEVLKNKLYLALRQEKHYQKIFKTLPTGAAEEKPTKKLFYLPPTWLVFSTVALLLAVSLVSLRYFVKADAKNAYLTIKTLTQEGAP